MIFCFDIDGTLCDTEGSDYINSVPRQDIIDEVNRLFSEGHYIKIFTARGATSGMDLRAITASQLRWWGVNYHELIMGKPHADVFVDDKVVNLEELKKRRYFKHDWRKR